MVSFPSYVRPISKTSEVSKAKNIRALSPPNGWYWSWPYATSTPARLYEIQDCVAAVFFKEGNCDISATCKGLPRKSKCNTANTYSLCAASIVRFLAGTTAVLRFERKASAEYQFSNKYPSCFCLSAEHKDRSDLNANENSIYECITCVSLIRKQSSPSNRGANRENFACAGGKRANTAVLHN